MLTNFISCIMEYFYNGMQTTWEMAIHYYTMYPTYDKNQMIRYTKPRTTHFVQDGPVTKSVQTFL